MNSDATPTEEQLIAFARSLEGQLLHTRARHKPFHVTVESKRLVYHPKSPESSEGAVRRLAASALTKTIELFRQTGSFTTTDYQKFTVNASYTLTVIGLYQDQGRDL